jgi:monoamine oxidase
MTNTHAGGACAYFAGDHTSLKHAWIEGSLESAVRAALEVHDRD